MCRYIVLLYIQHVVCYIVWYDIVVYYDNLLHCTLLYYTAMYCAILYAIPYYSTLYHTLCCTSCAVPSSIASNSMTYFTMSCIESERIMDRIFFLSFTLIGLMKKGEKKMGVENLVCGVGWCIVRSQIVF